MIFDVLTLFPEMINAVINESIIKRAIQNGLIEINPIDIRDFSTNKHKKVDDYPYGGGLGMIMSVQPIFDAYQSIISKLNYKPQVIYLSPQGKLFDQTVAERIKNSGHVILLCGHYEGVDERILEEIVDEEISIGDYVLTGGEIPSLVVIDSVSRLVPGVLSSSESYLNESISSGMLEYPQYTRPETILGRSVPNILLSGHHANIEEWRRRQSILRTYNKRTDIYEQLELSQKDLENLEEDMKER